MGLLLPHVRHIGRNRKADRLIPRQSKHSEAAVTRSCELYLRVAAGQPGGWPDLDSAVRTARPAVILITGLGASADAALLRPFISAARRLDLAVMIENDVHLAKALDADGVHLRAGSDALAEARALLGEEKSIGVSCVLSRHEAMTMAEGGADYIAFGEFGLDGDAGAEDVADMVQWWAEIFEVPCVAWGLEQYSDDELSGLVRAGADYLCIGLASRSEAEAVGRYASILRSDPTLSA
jgi:thiamine-phosphate pyrophosphorylase